MKRALSLVSCFTLFLACGSDSKPAGTGGSGGSPTTGGSGGSGGGAMDASADRSGNTPDMAPAGDGASPGNVSAMMTFFVTSKGMGKGGNLGGLAGADAYCKSLAMAVSPALGAKDWKAYLSTSTVNAITRIGNGPWYNAKGMMIAPSAQVLHEGQAAMGPLNATWPIGTGAFAVILDEKGGTFTNDVHDMLTGSTMAGMVDGTNTCSDWTATTGMAGVGHGNRDGGGRPPSWNQAHTAGCGPEVNDQGTVINRQAGTVTSGGGRGSFYCFVP
jgi:hypothetical protein